LPSRRPAQVGRYLSRLWCQTTRRVSRASCAQSSHPIVLRTSRTRSSSPRCWSAG